MQNVGHGYNSLINLLVTGGVLISQQVLGSRDPHIGEFIRAP